MSGLNTTRAANSIRLAVSESIEYTVFRNNQLFKLFADGGDSPGDTAYRWNLNSAKNDSVKTYDEGDAFPDPGYQAVQRGAVSYTYLVGSMQITGHALDALKNGGYTDHVALESDGLEADLLDLATTTALSGTNGLETAVDATSSYAGVTRGGGWFDSQETPVNGPISFDAVQSLYYDLLDAEVGAKPDLIVVSPTQGQKYYQISGMPGMKLFQPTDPAAGMSSQTFNGLPLVELPDTTNSILLMLCRQARHFEFVTHRRLQVNFRGRAGDSDVFDFTMAYALVCRNPKHQGKLTGLTT